MAAVGQLFVFIIFRAGVGGAAQHEHALALFRHVFRVRRDGIQPHIGRQRNEVRLELAVQMGLGIHLGRFGNVAALDVRDGHKALPAQVFQRGFIGQHAVQAQRLVIGDLHLEAARHAPRGFDDIPVEAEDVLALGESLVHTLRGDVGKIGVQPHANGAFFGHGLIQTVYLQHNVLLLCVYPIASIVP